MLDAQRGDQTGRYTLWIELSAFSSRHAILQDGPEICYQKLLRELSDAELQGSDGTAVTDREMRAINPAGWFQGLEAVGCYRAAMAGPVWL